MTNDLHGLQDRAPDTLADGAEAPVPTPDSVGTPAPISPAARGCTAGPPKPPPAPPATPEEMRDALAAAGYPAPGPVDLLPPERGPYGPADYLGAVAAQADALAMPALRAAAAAALRQTKADGARTVADARKAWSLSR